MTRAATEFDLRMKELAASEPDRPALIFTEAGRAVSYRELDGVTEALKRELRSRLSGVESGCVLTSSANEADSYLSFVAALRCPVPVAVKSRLEGDRSLERLLSAGFGVLDASEPGRLDLRPPEAHCSTAQVSPHALILPTGGTSGGGKHVVDTKLRMVSSQPRPLRLTSMLGWRPHQVQMMASTPPHASSVAFFVEGLTDGNTIVVTPGFQAATFLETVDKHEVEWLQVTPFHMRMMQRADNGDWSLSSVRALVHMSARCADGLKRYWIERLGAQRVYETYGSTEGIGVTTVRGDEWLRRPGTVGKGFFTKVRIVDSKGEVAAVGARGLVYTSVGRRRAGIYLSRQDRLRQRADGLASVGDEGWLDAEGYLYLAARSLTRITIAGETFNAEDVEDELCNHPDVADAGVCSVERGEDRVRVIALVVPAEHPIAEGDLRRWLRTRVAGAIVPRRIFCVDSLPRDGAGKLSRRKLQLLGQRLIGVEKEAG